jgi:hypothetical protein
MYVAFRTHVKNEKRLALLDRTLKSCAAQGIDSLGPVFVVDDGSPMKDEVKTLTQKYRYNYKPAILAPGDTKNGLAESLNLEPGSPCLACVDDIVFGKGSLDIIRDALLHGIPSLESRGIPWGLISSFACYDRQTPIGDSNLWLYPTQLFYAAVCCLYNPTLQKEYVSRWEAAVRGDIPYPKMCDDILLKIICIEKGYINFNTMFDAVQHTGINARTFGENEQDPGANYTTKYFVGE